MAGIGEGAEGGSAGASEVTARLEHARPGVPVESNMVGVLNGLLQTLIGTLDAQVEAQGGLPEASAA